LRTGHERRFRLRRPAPLRSGDSYLATRTKDGAEVFEIKELRHAEHWRQRDDPVMLVIRASDGSIRWMDVGSYLEERSRRKTPIRRVEFQGEPFTALNLLRLRDRIFGGVPAPQRPGGPFPS
jgi:hypothetical protein